MDFLRVVLPYCIERQQNGRYVALNRDYKPVGFRTSEYIDYAAYPVAFELKGLTRAKAGQIDCRGRENPDQIWLYDDGCIPTCSARAMRDYLDRLAILATLKVDY